MDLEELEDLTLEEEMDQEGVGARQEEEADELEELMESEGGEAEEGGEEEAGGEEEEGDENTPQERGAGTAGGAGSRPREPDREAPAFSAEHARLLEQETTQRLQEQYDRDIAGLGVVNPYTGKVIGSFAEFKAYGEQFRKETLKAEAEKQGKTVEQLEEEQENQSFLSQLKEREKAQQEAAQAAAKRRDFLSRDLADFLAEFPDVDVVKLEGDARFRKFAGKRLYQEPLKELYRDYTELMGETERATAAKVTGKQARSTGGGQGGGGVTLSPAQAQALEEWNRENPELKMTAKEFLER